MLLNEINLLPFFSNNWYYLGALTISGFVAIISLKTYLKKNKSTEDLQPVHVNSNINPKINSTNTINVNVGNSSSIKDEKAEEIRNTSTEGAINNYKVDSLKSKIKILFIDDDKKFNVVKILKDSGWKNTISVVDIKSIDIQVVKDSDIFFVDINGVGKLLMCEHEGLDIALMLKQKYPDKKVVIYSANKNNNAFHEAWDKCDFKLEKNALPYQFQRLVEQYSLSMYP